MKELLQFISEGGSVVRYHTRTGIKPDTDAHHSHGVAMLCSIIAGTGDDGKTLASVNLIMAALTHDLAEQKVGDVSAPAKRSMAGVSELLDKYETAELQRYNLDYAQHLTPTERLTLKMADCFDGMMYCCREAALGNRNVRLIWGRFCAYAETLTSDVETGMTVGLRASVVYEAIKEIYKETTSASGPTFNVFAGQ